MRIKYFTPLQLIILIIAENCWSTTDCADSGRKREKDPSATPSTSRVKKLKKAEGEASTSGVATEARTSSNEQVVRLKPLDNDILNSYYNYMRRPSGDWKTTYDIMRVRHPNIPPLESVQRRVHTLVQRIIYTTPAWGENGETLWTKKMKSEVLRIYYQTKRGDPAQQATRMYKKWRNECPKFPDISPTDLLQQAENMLMRNNILELPADISGERASKVFADKGFEFNSERKDILRNAFRKMPPNKSINTDKFYDELCREHPIFYRISPRRVLDKAKYLSEDREGQRQTIQALQEADEEIDPLYQSHHEIHPQRFHHFAEGMGSSSLYQGPSYYHSDLDLSLGSPKVGTPQIHLLNVNRGLETPETQHSNVDLELSLSSQKRKGKSIWKQ